MENILIDFFKTRLNTIEKQQLDTTGFLVRDTGFNYLILNLLFIIFWIPGDLLIFSLITQSPIIILSIVLGMAFTYISWFAWQYAKFSIIFYHSKGIISGGKVYSAQKELINEIIGLSNPLKLLFEKRMSKLYSIIIKIKLLRQKLWMFYLFLWFGVFMVGSQEKGMLIEAFKIFGIYTLMIIFVISIAYIAHYNSIYYKFGNLGKKIQSLTPQIEEQSKKIKSEFQSDMNFSVLSNGFDSLSSTFSNIVTLVIKLERVEARANKGNLFDSEKYINSLRSDIVTPLTSLKTFLEKQKIELMQSQKEFTRVRVGGSESGGNIDLQSKRSESLIIELTENIEKLNVMIGKIGK